MEKLIQSIKKFLDDGANKDILINKNKNIHIDFKRLTSGHFDIIIAEQLLDVPEETLALFSLIYSEITEREAKFHFYNLPESNKIMIRHIKKEDIGKLFSFDVVVGRVCDNTAITTSIKYECPNCGNIIDIKQSLDVITKPTRCSCGRKGIFKIKGKIQQNVQKIVIEDFISEVSENFNPIKRMGIIKGGLVQPSVLQPGARAEITGIIKTKPISKESVEEEFYIEINNIILKDHSFYNLKLNNKDIEKIKKLSKDTHLMKKFIQSISPGTEGMELIRKALVLQHFRTENVYDENGNLDDRGTINICLIGNPGTNKSYVASKSIKLNPIHMFTSGRGVSGVGLVGAVSFDKSLNRWVLDAGGLPICHLGVICIDEADKISTEDIAYLNNAMASLTVPFNKANIKQTLKTDVSVLLCGNPTNRVFDSSVDKFRQLGVPQDILDRFDLIFAVVQQQQETFRKKVIYKIIKRHKREIKPIIDWDLFGKYVAYTWQNIHPEITKNIEEYILDKIDEILGPKTQKKDEVSFRIIGNILRLAKAHARVYLSNKIRTKDIDAAVELLIVSFKSLDMLDESQYLNVESYSMEPTKNIKKAYHIILDILDNKKEIEEHILFDTVGLTQIEFDEVMNKLKKGGEIFEPRRGIWKRL